MSKESAAWVWQWPSINVELHVSAKVAELLSMHRQGFDEAERGGQLFIDINYDEGLLLAEATAPHAKDKSSSMSLLFDKSRCKEEILNAKSKNLLFAGYWHTHPEPIPHISPLDINSFEKFAKKNKQFIPYPLAVIVGRSESPEGIRAWSIRPNGAVLATIF